MNKCFIIFLLLFCIILTGCHIDYVGECLTSRNGKKGASAENPIVQICFFDTENYSLLIVDPDLNMGEDGKYFQNNGKIHLENSTVIDSMLLDYTSMKILSGKFTGLEIKRGRLVMTDRIMEESLKSY